MKYLGSISGHGILQHDGVGIADVVYELEGFVQRGGSITGCGEIGLTSSALQNVIDQPNLQLLTNTGHLLDIKISDRKIRAGSHIHVDVTGNLPSEREWH